MVQPKPRNVADRAVVLTMLLFLSGCDKEFEKHRDVLERGNGSTPKDMHHEPVSELPAWDQERRDALRVP